MAGPVQVVNNIYDKVINYANNQINTANENIADITALSSDIESDIKFSNINFPTIQYVPVTLEVSDPELPNLTVTYTTGADIPLPSYNEIDINTGTTPALDLTAPNPALPTSPTLTNKEFSGEAPGITEKTLPTAPTISIPEAPGDGGAAAPSITIPTAPAVTATAPTLTIPTSTGVISPAFPDLNLQLSTVAIPDSPSITNPALPTLSAISTAIDYPNKPSLVEASVPDTPSTDTITFDGVLPTIALPEVPTFVYDNSSYDSYQFQDTVTSLLNTWVYGVPAGLSEPIWAQAQAKAAQTLKEAKYRAYTDYAGRGFVAPDGPLQVHLEEIERQVSTELAGGIARGVEAETQAGITLATTALQQAVQYEQILVNNFNTTQQRALDAAVATYNGSLQYIDYVIKRYNLELDIYKTQADVYRTQIQAELDKVELFKAQIQAQSLVIEMNRAKIEQYNSELQAELAVLESEKIKVNIDESQIALYKAQIDANNQLINIYTAELQGASTQATINNQQLDGNRILVDVYRAQVENENLKLASFNAGLEGEKLRLDLYTGELEADNIRNNIFNTQLQGEKTKIDIYSAQLAAYAQDIDIYNSRVNSLNTIIGLYNAQLESVQKQYDFDKNKIQVYEAQLSAYGENLKADSQKIELYGRQVDANNTEINQYDSQVRAFLGRVQAYGAELDAQKLNAQIDNEVNQLKNTDFENRLKKLQSDNEVESAELDQRVKVWNATLDRYNSEVGLRETEARVNVEVVKAHNEVSLQQTQIALQEATATVTAAVEKYRLLLQSLQSIGEVSSSIASASINALDAGAQISTQYQFGTRSGQDWSNFPGDAAAFPVLVDSG